MELIERQIKAVMYVQKMEYLLIVNIRKFVIL